MCVCRCMKTSVTQNNFLPLLLSKHVHMCLSNAYSTDPGKKYKTGPVRIFEMYGELNIKITCLSLSASETDIAIFFLTQKLTACVSWLKGVRDDNRPPHSDCSEDGWNYVSK